MPDPERPPDRFDAALRLAVVRSERVRAAVLATLLGGMSLIVGGIWLATADDFAALSAHAGRRYLSMVVILGGALYELIWCRILARFEAAGRRPSAWLMGANAAVEVSIPTLAIGVFTTFVPPPEALIAPPSYGYLIFVALTILQLDPRISLWAGALAAAQYSGLALYHADAIAAHPGSLLGVMPAYHIRSLFLALGGVCAALVARELRRRVVASITSVQERERVLDLFGQHVSPQVARALLAGEPAQASREVVVLFLDVRGFTAFSAARRPDEVVAYLDALLGPLMNTIRAHRGVVDKLLGDGFMAVFGAPEPDPDAAPNAVRAARAMLAQVDALVAGGLPPTRVGIGIHKGPAVAGLIGSGRRREYTVIGDTVNLAARVEGACKALDASLLVTEAVWRALPPAERVGERLPQTPIRGRGPVTLYRLTPGG